MSEPPRVTSLKSTQPLKTFYNFGGDLNFVHDPRGYKAVVHHLARSYLANKDGKITDPRLKLNKVRFGRTACALTSCDYIFL
jgi:polyamine oxidase